MSSPTTKFIGRFQIVDAFVSTSLASSYKALDPKTNEYVTLKVLRPHFFEDNATADKFKQTLLSYAQVGHDNIAKIFEVGQEGNELWVSRANVPFDSLRHLKLPAAKAEVTRIIGQVANTLDYLHSLERVHGDIKLSNIFFDGSKVVVTDHGMIAAIEHLPPLIKATLNTPQPVFAAPEFTQRGKLGVASDIYACGVLAFNLLTGEPPYYATDSSSMLAKQLTKDPQRPSELAPWLTFAVDEVILSAISIEPSRRQKSAGAFAEELRNALETVTWPSPVLLTATEHVSQSHTPAATLAMASAELAGGSVTTRNILIRLKRINRKKLIRNSLITIASLTILVGVWLLYDIVGLPKSAVHPSTTITAAYSKGEWPSFLGGPTHTGFIPEATAPIKGKVKWSFVTGDKLSAEPIIANGTVFLATTDKRVVALDPKDGSVKWEYKKGTGPIDSTPSVADGKVYFGLRDGRIIVLNANDGTTAWVYQTDGYIFTPPTVDKGVLYIGSGDNNLYALDAATGKKLWTFNSGSSIAGAATVNNGIVAISSWDGAMYLLDADTGKKRLRYVLPAISSGSLLIVGDTVYSGSARSRRNTLYSIDLQVSEIRTERWVRRFLIQLSVWGLVDYPAIKGTRWAVRLSEPTTWLTAADDKIYGLSQQGTLFTWDAATGKELSKKKLADRADSLPLVVGNTVYAATWFGDLYAFDRTSGNQVMKMQLNESITVPPAFAGDTLYIAAGNTLYAIE
ncbi:MAG: serine/threonine-protein kinase [Dehalococcoidia bacterium]|nr:serine/threonine-protein kinase [Dehalococcoidia bacterium]